jgi:hypothetical protein
MSNTVIKSENEYVERLSNIAIQGQANNTLLNEKSKEAIEVAKNGILDFIRNNEKTDDSFVTSMDLWNAYKDAVKNAECDFAINGLELKVIHNKLHRDVDYTAETIFYGLHLKRYFLDSFPKTNTEFEAVKSSITFTNGMALYHLLSEVKVRGLNKENYALANVLYKLSEISKVYQQYDQESAQINNEVRTWTMGLKKDEVAKIEDAVAETITNEVTPEA